jgi:DNA-binding winged helix-turn-helix (wHTH) protein
MIPTRLEYCFGPFRVVDGGRALIKEGEAVPISPKVLAVLVELLRVPGRVVSKTELLETVWAGSFVEDGNLTQSISVLRKLLAAGFPESPIETLPRVGYRFRSPVEIVDPSAAVQLPSRAEDTSPVADTPPAPASVGTDSSRRDFRRWNQRWAILLTLACFVVIAVASVVSLRLRNRVLAINVKNIAVWLC